mmetsp:Transcript_14273/g.42581  ORF Transcript_14273/g.42581 Transcript_14273/m.42581 type:complete len:110 (-) Transcript_14273:20-349(-)
MEAPSAGAFEDLEAKSLEEKVAFLRDHRDWKCNVRWELRDEHHATWAANGLRRASREGRELGTPAGPPLRPLGVAASSTVSLGDRAEKVTVDLELAGDWTDARAGADAD